MPASPATPARILGERHASVAVLVLTTYDSDEAIVRAVETGAVGYVLKDSPTVDLVDAVRRAAAGEIVLAPAVSKRLTERNHTVSPDALTPREIGVLRSVADGNTNAEIAALLHISEATVKTHLIRTSTRSLQCRTGRQRSLEPSTGASCPPDSRGRAGRAKLAALRAAPRRRGRPVDAEAAWAAIAESNPVFGPAVQLLPPES